MSIGRQKQAQILHKVMVLSLLMQEALDDTKRFMEHDTEFMENCKKIEEKCETIITTVFNVKEVKSSTYITELTNQVDTCIRKNFKPVSGPTD